MAASSFLLTFPFRLAVAACALFIWSTPSKSASACSFKSIISFGDSIADTGNAVFLYKPDRLPNFSFPPYGETFFHHSTGRCSDGRLIIDFIAQELGLPLVASFYGARQLGQGSSDNFLTGVNFAVVGATAMEDSFFHERGIRISLRNVSLVAQLGWFKDFLTGICQKSSDCENFLKTSLVFVGEIGGNDYNYAFLQGKTEAEIQSFIPKVIKVIGLAINELINLGAETLVVPGNFPFGCSAAYLTLFRSSNERDYDSKTGCINWLNRFVEHHNELLQMELNLIRKLHPGTTIIYADYYNAGIDLCRSPNEYGFVGGALRACCGGGGPYNVNSSVQCGDPQAICCEDPSLYVNWDGVHLTEAAYNWIARGLLQGTYISPPLSKICASTSSTSTGLYDY